MARELVLTAIGPVLTLPDTLERWNVRSESFTVLEKRREEKRREESLKGLPWLIPLHVVAGTGLTVWKRGEGLARQRGALARGYGTRGGFAREHGTAPAWGYRRGQFGGGGYRG